MPTRTAKHWTALFVPLVCIAAFAGTDERRSFRDVWREEYQELSEEISGSGMVGLGKAANENHNILDRHSLIWSTDQTPSDVVYRRTKALIEHISSMPNAPDLSSHERRHDSLRSWKGGLSKQSATEDKEIFYALKGLSRSVALSNPVIDFDTLIGVDKGFVGAGALIQTIGYSVSYFEKDWTYERFVTTDFSKPHTAPGTLELGDPRGFVFVTSLGGDKQTRVPVFDELRPINGYYKGQDISRAGRFGALWDLDWDRKRLTFSWRGNDGVCHVYVANIDATNCRQLTFGGFGAYDPVFLPNGRIAFVSHSPGNQVRCRPSQEGLEPCGLIHSIKPDGTDLIRLSYHETSEVCLSVDNNGMIVYTRWDYVDRDFNAAHHFWQCGPDGTDPRCPHGNYPYPHHTFDLSSKPADGRAARPWAEYFIRALPGTRTKYIATAATHHRGPQGLPIVIDVAIADDNRDAQVTKLIPGAYPTDGQSPPDYRFPWPLNEDVYLIKNGGTEILLDRFGNRTQVCGRAPMGLRPYKTRTRPPVPATKTYDGERKGLPEHKRATMSVTNVYNADFEWPENAKICALRLVELVGRPWWAGKHNQPSLGPSSASGRIVLGTVPVEEDGSAYFEAPVNKGLYIQALDENGYAIQSMRSLTYVHPGEQLSCLGCHEDKWKTAPPSETPMALKRCPSPITPEVGGVAPVTYGRLVRPMWESTCLPCHTKHRAAPNQLHSSMYYHHGTGWGANHGLNITGPDSWGGYRSKAGRVGMYGSKLGTAMLTKHKDRLTPEQLRQIAVWLDCHSMTYAACHDLDKQNRGEIVWPLLSIHNPANPLGVERDRPLPSSGCTPGTAPACAIPVGAVETYG